MSERKHVLRWYSAWNDDKEERWLEQMARSGWHLVSAPILFTFEKGAPAEVRYRLDYQSRVENIEEYLRLFRDAGWERVCGFAGWQYLRTASSDAPEIYTDTASRVAKYQRLLVFSLLMAVITMGANFSDLLDHSPGPRAHVIIIGVVRWAVVAIMCIWTYIIARLALHVRGLKRKAAASGRV